jgi:hypothetical protein
LRKLQPLIRRHLFGQMDSNIDITKVISLHPLSQIPHPEMRPVPNRHRPLHRLRKLDAKPILPRSPPASARPLCARKQATEPPARPGACSAHSALYRARESLPILAQRSFFSHLTNDGVRQIYRFLG